MGGGQWVKGTGMAQRKRSRLLCKRRGMQVLRLMIPISCKYFSHHFFFPFSASPLPLSSPASSLPFYSPYSQEASTHRPHIPHRDTDPIPPCGTGTQTPQTPQGGMGVWKRPIRT